MAKEKDKEEILVCSECGSNDVDYLAWVGANTYEYKTPFGPDGDSDNCWCNVCEEHTDLIPMSVWFDDIKNEDENEENGDNV